MNVLGFDLRDIRMLNSLFRMTLVDRFLGSRLGLVWAVLNPLLLLSIFCFVFSYVFPGRLPEQAGALPFVIWLISGYGPWIALMEGLMASTTSVVASAGIVKNIAFKSELLPISGALMGLVPLLVATVVLLILTTLDGRTPTPAYAFLPFVVLLQFTLVAGLGLFLSALNVFLRDTALLMPNVMLILLFASPIFYPLSAYPEAVRGIVVYNPLYVLAECFRSPIVNGTMPPLWMIVYITTITVGVFVGGLWWFRRLKSFFDTRL